MAKTILAAAAAAGIASMAALAGYYAGRASAFEARLAAVEAKRPGGLDPAQRAARQREARARQAQELARLAGALRSEPEDPPWASAAAVRLRRALGATTEPHGSVLELLCRRTLCGVVVQHAGPDARFEFNTRFPKQLGVEPAPELGEMMGQTYETDGGEWRTALYFVRPGAASPF